MPAFSVVQPWKSDARTKVLLTGGRRTGQKEKDFAKKKEEKKKEKRKKRFVLSYRTPKEAASV